MRVNGNVSPLTVSTTSYQMSNPAMKELRITENVEQIGVNNYVYDEYVFYLEDSDGDLSERVLEDLDNWLETGRNLEVNQNSSMFYHMEEEHTQELAELIEMIYEDDLEVIG